MDGSEREQIFSFSDHGDCVRSRAISAVLCVLCGSFFLFLRVSAPSVVGVALNCGNAPEDGSFAKIA